MAKTWKQDNDEPTHRKKQTASVVQSHLRVEHIHVQGKLSVQMARRTVFLGPLSAHQHVSDE